MFRLLKSGLPKDPIYPTDLEGLGYFINEEDEVRMISNPRAYFRFFLTKNERYNTVHREAMNGCLREEVLKRLQAIGMETVRLPLGVEEVKPHIPILVSSRISEKKRVVILFYEHTQDLGIFAYRIVGGRGGINAGSAVNFVRYIQSLSGPDNKDSPGIILANLGQLRWWHRGKKAVTHTSWFALPQKSAVSGAYRFDMVKNTVPSNRNAAEHVAYVFNHVVPDLLAPDALLEVIGVSLGAVELVDFFNKPQNWAIMEPRLAALALVATFHRRDEISNPWFADWLRKRGRAYVISNKPASTPIASSDGNTYTDSHDNTTTTSDCYGCPVYSLGEPYYSELMLPKGYKVVLDWFQEVANGGESYENPQVVIESLGQEREDSGESIDWDEFNGAEVQAGKLKGVELKCGESEIETTKAGEVTGEKTRVEGSTIEEPKIEKPKTEELKIEEPGIKDPYIQKMKEVEHKSSMDWGAEVWEEEMKIHGLKMEDLERDNLNEDKVLGDPVEERGVDEGGPKVDDDELERLETTSRQSNEPKESMVEELQRLDVKETGPEAGLSNADEMREGTVRTQGHRGRAVQVCRRDMKAA